MCLPVSLSAQFTPCELRWYAVTQDGSPNSPGVLLSQAAAFDSRRQVEVFFGGENPITGVRPTSATWEWKSRPAHPAQTPTRTRLEE